MSQSKIQHLQSNITIVGPATNVHVQRWARALSERGWRVSLISTAPANHAWPADLQHLPLLTLPVAQAGMSAPARIATLLRGWARVPALIRTLKPDLIHVHSLPTPAAVPFLMRVRPLIVSAWGSDVVQRDRRKARWYPRLLAHADQITATSRYLADVTATYLRQPRPINVVPFGVDLDRFQPATEPPSAPIIGTLRHLEPIYGLDVLIDALPSVRRQAPHIRCLIGGAGSQRAALERRAIERGVADAVTFLGRIDHAAVPRLLRSWRLFINPSRAESFGVAALEAQACGVPVIGSHVGGLPEIVRDGATGLLVPPDDPVALAQAISTLLRDDQRWRDMARAARVWAVDRYDWRISVDQMLAVYAQVR